MKTLDDVVKGNRNFLTLLRSWLEPIDIRLFRRE